VLRQDPAEDGRPLSEEFGDFLVETLAVVDRESG
jgi:hypothetical protein